MQLLAHFYTSEQLRKKSSRGDQVFAIPIPGIWHAVLFWREIAPTLSTVEVRWPRSAPEGLCPPKRVIMIEPAHHTRYQTLPLESHTTSSLTHLPPSWTDTGKAGTPTD